MNHALDLIIVVCAITTALAFAFLALAPRRWRARVLQTLGDLAAKLPLPRVVARRLNAAAGRVTGCGGCGDCGSDQSGAAAEPPAEVHVPLSSLQRRR